MGELVAALTSDPAYLPIWYPGLFGPAGGDYLAYELGTRLRHSPLTLHIRRYDLLGEPPAVTLNNR